MMWTYNKEKRELTYSGSTFNGYRSETFDWASVQQLLSELRMAELVLVVQGEKK